MRTDKIILGDLGGTKLRLAWRGPMGPGDIVTFKQDDLPSLQAGIQKFAQDTKDATLLLSFARRGDENGVYKMDQPHKKGAWSFTLDDLKRDCGLADVHILHDMQAMGRAVFHHDSELFESVIGGKGGAGPRIVINVGTGLGHAYADPSSHQIGDTFGGHFAPAAVTHEQREALRLLEKGFHEDRSFIWEEILSGRGLEALEGQTMDGTRLFCEFLGLYAQTLAITGHAFGGVYLCGGVIEGLFAGKAFQAQSFADYFRGHHVPIVDAQLGACPLFYASKAHTALYGLDVYAQSLSHH